MANYDVAIHEAGHAVIGIAYGLSVAYATIEPAEFLRKERMLNLEPLDVLVEALKAMGKKRSRIRSDDGRDVFDVLAPLMEAMREGESIIGYKDAALAMCSEIQRTGGVIMKSLVRRVRKQISSYRPRRISTAGHVRVGATREKLDQIIMMASGGAAVRHFYVNLSEPFVPIDGGDSIDNEMIEDFLRLLYPGPNQTDLRRAVELDLRDEAARAVELNGGYIEDIAFALEQRTRLDITEIEALLAETSATRKARYTRVRPPARAR